MTKKILLFIGITLMLFMLPACGAKKKSENTWVSSDVEFGEQDYEKITVANNTLGFRLIQEIDGDEQNNAFVSPTSLLMALSMVYNGADGITKEEIAKALKIEGVDASELNKANASLVSMLMKSSEEIQLNVANSIWLNENYHFQEDFSKNNKDYFNAEIQEINIHDNDSVTRINDWVKKSTNKKIEEIVEAPLDPDLVAILMNAIYFKGNWTYEFDEKQTEMRPFYLEDGNAKEVPLMTLQKDLNYMENEDFQAVQLPYGDGEMSMNVFLPKETSSLDEFTRNLTNENWLNWDAEFSKQEGAILLPKFQLEYEVDLNETLETLGMPSAFKKDAVFTKMIQEDVPLWISKVKQKTFIDVHEKGTEAAAVTSVEMVTESAPANPPFYMEVNRPFFLTITDDKTNAILFMGWISEP
ncbi:serpin family protein [Sporosarcina siberiensis]|uniref:Serpin family protein n=1 Tax=Sporosarcina siberiensis TaxID=1365606 RepID=A0ABW4SBA5_9BACL